MKIIEFFGPPCSGKTSKANLLTKKKSNFISSNNLIFNHTNEILKLNIFDKTALKYMSLVKYIKQSKILKNKKFKKNFYEKKKIKDNLTFKSTYTNLMIKRYRGICRRLYNLYSKENLKFIKFFLRNLKKIKDKKIRENYEIWFEEIAAKYFIAQNLKINKTVVFDEGFIQRSFFLYHSTNNYRNKVNEYLSLIDCPDYAIYLDANAKSLLKRSNLRKSQEENTFVYKDLKDIKKYKVFFKYIFRQIN
tara:strand:- start:11 stop:754 length:744 start_codon:yes stop_codon:yes gene_type:complete